MTYAIWCPFEMPPNKGVRDIDEEFEVAGCHGRVKREMHFHVLMLGGIGSKDEAEALST